MTSKNVSSVDTTIKSHKLCLYKLVQRANDVMREQWIADCTVAFGWTREYSVDLIDKLRREANLEMTRERQKLEL